MRRIGVFGGTFDPVHNAHLVLAERARAALGLERVVFVPARIPPHKKNAAVAPAADRLRMVRLATKGKAHFAVSDIELRRRGPSYTVDTIRAFKRRFGSGVRLFFLIGADSVPELPKWRDVGTLARLCEIVPLPRPAAAKPRLADLAKAVGKSEARALLERTIAMPLMDISATDIRRRTAEGRSIRRFVPEAVREHILKKGLYKKRAQPPGRKAARAKRGGARACSA